MNSHQRARGVIWIERLQLAATALSQQLTIGPDLHLLNPWLFLLKKRRERTSFSQSCVLPFHFMNAGRASVVTINAEYDLPDLLIRFLQPSFKHLKTVDWDERLDSTSSP